MIRHYYAGAAKVRMELFESDGTTLKKAYDYMGGMVYVEENSTKTLDFISVPEGRLLLTHKILETTPDSVIGDKFRYEYALRDHLGNTRVSCRCGDPKRGEDGNILTGEAAGIDSIMVVQENNYDPWGLSFGSSSESQNPKSLANRFQYNGKEKIADMDLGWSDYGARMYDPSIGRWNVVDPLTESQGNWGVYHYVYDNPVKNTDPDGREPCCQGVIDYFSGLSDAVTSNFSPLAKNYVKDKNSSSYSDGVKAGHLLSMGIAATETVAGGAGVIVSVLGEGLTLGGATPVAVPLAAVSGTAVLHGGDSFIKVYKNLNSEGQSNSRNPDGAKGKPDHQAKVKELAKKAEAENPDADIITERKIKIPEFNKRPDVQVVDRQTGKTKKVYEAERKPQSTRNKKREAEYQRLNIPNETHKVGN